MLQDIKFLLNFVKISWMHAVSTFGNFVTLKPFPRACRLPLRLPFVSFPWKKKSTEGQNVEQAILVLKHEQNGVHMWAKRGARLIFCNWKLILFHMKHSSKTDKNKKTSLIPRFPSVKIVKYFFIKTHNNHSSCALSWRNWRTKASMRSFVLFMIQRTMNPTMPWNGTTEEQILPCRHLFCLWSK